MTRVRLSRIFWIGAAAILIVAALVAIAGLLRSDFTDTDGKILLTLLALLVASGTAVSGLTLVDRGTFALVGWPAVGIAALCFALIVASTWNDFDSETLAKWAGTAALVLIGALLATTQLMLHRGRLAAVVLGTWLVVFLAVMTTSVGLWSEPSDDGTWKAAGTFWILGVLGWLLLPVLQRFTAAGTPPGEARVLATLDDVELVATRSGTEVRLAPGERVLLRRRV